MKHKDKAAKPKGSNRKRRVIKLTVLGAVLVALPFLVKWWWSPAWDPSPRIKDGRVVFEPYKTIHPAHYGVGDMWSILTKVDFKYTLMMATKDLSRFFSDDSISYEIGNDRLDDYYKNFEGHFDHVAKVGSKAYDFELTTIEGDTIKLSDFRGKPVAFMFGAVTCPPAVLQRDAWAMLEDKYSDNEAEILVVYSVEQHPGEAGYPDFTHPENFEEKMTYAKLFGESTDIPIAVDSFDKAVLRQYDPLPNPAYVIDAEGYIVFKSSWADVHKVDKVLETLLAEAT